MTKLTHGERKCKSVRYLTCGVTKLYKMNVVKEKFSM